MSHPFEAKEATTDFEQFSQSTMINQIKDTFNTLPDSRTGKGNNQKYSISDAAMSAYSIFFMQSPSFLDHQKSMQKEKDKNNAESLFGVHEIPSDNQIRNLLDSINPSSLKALYHSFLNGVEQQGKLMDFKSLNNGYLVALDGVEYFGSQKISCPQCLTKKLKNGKTHHSHIAVTPVIVSPDQSSVIPLVPEFVCPEDGVEKQDYELAASKRWLESENDFIPENTTYLGDDLYCHQPFCEQIIEQKKHFILVCKPDSHKTLYEWVDDFERMGKVSTLKKRHWTGKQHLTECYRFVNQVPLKNTDDALYVNWCELAVFNDKGELIYRNAFATNYELNEKNVAEIVRAGRTRWKIENENNNTLKTKGYNFKHNYGHGSKNLSSLLASLIILAFFVHTLLEWFDECYQLLREYLPSRKTFFDDLRALTRYMHFKDWQKLMKFMLHGLEIPIPQGTN